MSILSPSSLLGSSRLLSGVFQVVDNLLGTVAGATGGTKGGLVSAGVLDGLVDLKLLNKNAVANLALFDADRDGDGLISLGLLDKDGDGFVDIGLLNKNLGVSLLDTAGKGLLDVNLLDAVKVGAKGDLGLGAVGGLLGGSSDPAAYQVVLDASAAPVHLGASAKAAFVKGQAGLDTVTYARSADGVTVQSDAGGVFVGDGTKVDYLRNVERIGFADGTLALDTGAGETAGMAFRLYQAALDRTPDKGGLKYWIDKLDAGASITSVADGFLRSAEFQKAYGSTLSNLDFVETLYDNILHRAGEAGGLSYWTGKLDGGLASRADVLLGFSESGENVALVGATIDAGVFLT